MSDPVTRYLAVALVSCGAWSVAAPSRAQDDVAMRARADPSAEEDPVAVEEPDATVARVRVMPVECEEVAVDLDEAVRLLGIELVGDDVETVAVLHGDVDDEQPGEDLARVHLRPMPCEPEATEIEVTVDDAVTRKRVQRVVDLSGLPGGARPRALALGVAELLRASWTELVRAEASQPAVPLSAEALGWITTQAAIERTEPADAAAPPADVASPVDEPEPAPPARASRLSAAAMLRAFPADGSSLLGARLAATLPLGVDLPLRIRFEGTIEYGRVRVALGDVDVGLAAGALAVDVSSAPGQSVGIDLGPRLEIGYGWAAGTPSDATDVGLEGSAAVVILSAHANLRVGLGGAWNANADLQVGHTLAGLDAQVDDRSTTGLVGPALALAVGLGVEL